MGENGHVPGTSWQAWLLYAKASLVRRSSSSRVVQQPVDESE